MLKQTFLQTDSTYLEAYQGLCQTFMMDFFAEKINGYKQKSSVINILYGCKYAPERFYGIS